MARIRTVKPEFFKHLELFELEEETGLPLRVAFAALWTVADREGRFKWIPRQLKIECLPYDNIDFSRVLHALATREFIKKYTVNFVEYGWIPGFKTHQVINNRESESVLPEPGEFDDFTRDARVNHASTTRENDPENTSEMGDFRPENSGFSEGMDKTGKDIENNELTRGSRVDHACSGEGKGKEGKGREGKGRESAAATRAEIFDVEPERIPESENPTFAKIQDWKPGQEAMKSIRMQNVPEEFITEQLPEFRTYWETQSHAPPYDPRFVKSVLGQWKLTGHKWKPKAVLQAGISKPQTQRKASVFDLTGQNYASGDL